MATYNQVFVPEVIGQLVFKHLNNKLQAMSYMNVDRTLAAQPGNTIKIPTYTYSGAATVVGEGQAVTFGSIASAAVPYEVQKVAAGFKATDEEVLYGLGDVLGLGIRGMSEAIADKIDSDFYAELGNATLTSTVAALNYQGIVASLAKFNNENVSQGEVYLFINQADYAGILVDEKFIHASTLGDNTLVNGAVGRIAGAQVIVSNKVAADSAFLVKQGAVSLFLKQDVVVETDRDITTFTNVATASTHSIVALTDATKVVAITVA